MNLKIIKLLIINVIIVNYFNFALSSELIIPKNKPSIEKYDIQLNEINYLLPKKSLPLLNKKLKLKKLRRNKQKLPKRLVIQYFHYLNQLL